jgi:hypothetical protein
LSPANLADQGFRFTFRPGAGWNWRQDVAAGDVDATDMTEEEFVQAVRDSE